MTARLCTTSDRFQDGHWFTTSAGTRYSYTDPLPEDIEIHWVAHHLSIENRWCGASRIPVSVAQHCLLVSIIAQDLFGKSFAWDGWGHDAREAVVKDIPSPMKRLPCMAGYRALENQHAAIFAIRFGFSDPLPPQIHHADMVALAIERRDFVAENPYWREPSELVLRARDRYRPLERMTALDAEAAYLARFHELGGVLR